MYIGDKLLCGAYIEALCGMVICTLYNSIPYGVPTESINQGTT